MKKFSKSQLIKLERARSSSYESGYIQGMRTGLQIGTYSILGVIGLGAMIGLVVAGIIL